MHDESTTPYESLVALVARLRSKDDGCPWDRRQTHQSMLPYLIEESYEVIEAVENGDDVHLQEELGDLLFQVVFHARMAEEARRFTLAELIERLVQKMRARHPHVFGTSDIADDEALWEQWHRIKAEEQQHRDRHSVMDGVPRSLPALVRALKMQRRAARVASHAPNSHDCHKVLKGVLEHGCPEGSQEQADAWIGSMLYWMVALARSHDVDPEQVLTHTTDHFEEAVRASEGTEAADTIWDAMTMVSNAPQKDSR